ncbi:alpha/beta-hydrolase family protein [Paracoccus sp. SCSIO 75233]|uniref:alpha/beta hydrolase n=1 Tax=Paracoccus sp. SCSIO 75233 TaxID=3017782 RepID=UPI0022F02C3D|nr:alpha/beta-hydrolase family protein [Paracoccus sp. SCSIO 75233]WBU54306.1 alpha/beta-hydrolase family protein [Paracoccus sp. SCSIO 75233]
MNWKKPFGVSWLPLFLGLIFFSASLTPSLIPRGWLMQGLLGGVVAAIGYMIGRLLLSLWRQMELPKLRGSAFVAGHVLVAIPVMVIVVLALSEAGNWQNEIRARMELEPLAAFRTVQMVYVALGVFVALMVLGWLVKMLFDRTRRWLYRFMPERTANVAGLLIVALLLFVVTRDGIVDRMIGFFDETYTVAQRLFDTDEPRPTDPMRSGSAESLIGWDAMGQPGRNFINGGPGADAIAAFSGEDALDPLRVYVGLANAETAQARSDMALAELQRIGAFDRKILIVAMPTGTGWLDPGSFDVLEYMQDGDIATVAVQYSYLQSPLALILETNAGLEQARSLISTVHEYWRGLPEDDRPRIYIHGLSLGAWASMYGTDLEALLDDPIDGALWAGPPFPSARWNEAMAARNPGSPYVAPDVGKGRLFRFASHTKPAGGPDGWGDMRLMFLQYSSDPIVFYEPASLFRPPAWMTEPPAEDVSPDLRFMPVVTQFQLALDMAFSLAAPAGHGHSYYAHDYIGAWEAVTAPEGWTAEDTERLKQVCNNGLQQGCDR